MKRLALVVLACLALTGCTFVRYTAADGAVVTVFDFRLSGNAMRIEAEKTPNGAILRASRDQQSPENTVEAVGKAAGDIINPARGLIP